MAFRLSLKPADNAEQQGGQNLTEDAQKKKNSKKNWKHFFYMVEFLTTTLERCRIKLEQTKS